MSNYNSNQHKNDNGHTLGRLLQLENAPEDDDIIIVKEVLAKKPVKNSIVVNKKYDIMKNKQRHRMKKAMKRLSVSETESLNIWPRKKEKPLPNLTSDVGTQTPLQSINSQNIFIGNNSLTSWQQEMGTLKNQVVGSSGPEFSDQSKYKCPRVTSDDKTVAEFPLLDELCPHKKDSETLIFSKEADSPTNYSGTKINTGPVSSVVISPSNTSDLCETRLQMVPISAQLDYIHVQQFDEEKKAQVIDLVDEEWLDLYNRSWKRGKCKLKTYTKKSLKSNIQQKPNVLESACIQPPPPVGSDKELPILNNFKINPCDNKEESNIISVNTSENENSIYDKNVILDQEINAQIKEKPFWTTVVPVFSCFEDCCMQSEPVDIFLGKDLNTQPNEEPFLTQIVSILTYFKSISKTVEVKKKVCQEGELNIEVEEEYSLPTPILSPCDNNLEQEISVKSFRMISCKKNIPINKDFCLAEELKMEPNEGLFLTQRAPELSNFETKSTVLISFDEDTKSEDIERDMFKEILDIQPTENNILNTKVFKLKPTDLDFKEMKFFFKNKLLKEGQLFPKVGSTLLLPEEILNQEILENTIKDKEIYVERQVECLSEAGQATVVRTSENGESFIEEPTGNEIEHIKNIQVGKCIKDPSLPKPEKNYVSILPKSETNIQEIITTALPNISNYSKLKVDFKKKPIDENENTVISRKANEQEVLDAEQVIQFKNSYKESIILDIVNSFSKEEECFKLIPQNLTNQVLKQKKDYSSDLKDLKQQSTIFNTTQQNHVLTQHNKNAVEMIFKKTRGIIKELDVQKSDTECFGHNNNTKKKEIVSAVVKNRDFEEKTIDFKDVNAWETNDSELSSVLVQIENEKSMPFDLEDHMLDHEIPLTIHKQQNIQVIEPKQENIQYRPFKKSLSEPNLTTIFESKYDYKPLNICFKNIRNKFNLQPLQKCVLKSNSKNVRNKKAHSLKKIIKVIFDESLLQSKVINKDLPQTLAQESLPPTTQNPQIDLIQENIILNLQMDEGEVQEVINKSPNKFEEKNTTLKLQGTSPVNSKEKPSVSAQLGKGSVEKKVLNNQPLQIFEQQSENWTAQKMNEIDSKELSPSLNTQIEKCNIKNKILNEKLPETFIHKTISEISQSITNKRNPLLPVKVDKYNVKTKTVKDCSLQYEPLKLTQKNYGQFLSKMVEPSVCLQSSMSSFGTTSADNKVASEYRSGFFQDRNCDQVIQISDQIPCNSTPNVSTTTSCSKTKLVVPAVLTLPKIDQSGYEMKNIETHVTSNLEGTLVKSVEFNHAIRQKSLLKVRTDNKIQRRKKIKPKVQILNTKRNLIVPNHLQSVQNLSLKRQFNPNASLLRHKNSMIREKSVIANDKFVLKNPITTPIYQQSDVLGLNINDPAKSIRELGSINLGKSDKSASKIHLAKQLMLKQNQKLTMLLAKKLKLKLRRQKALRQVLPNLFSSKMVNRNKICKSKNLRHTVANVSSVTPNKVNFQPEIVNKPVRKQIDPNYISHIKQHYKNIQIQNNKPVMKEIQTNYTGSEMQTDQDETKCLRDVNSAKKIIATEYKHCLEARLTLPFDINSKARQDIIENKEYNPKNIEVELKMLQDQPSTSTLSKGSLPLSLPFAGNENSSSYKRCQENKNFKSKIDTNLEDMDFLQSRKRKRSQLNSKDNKRNFYYNREYCTKGKFKSEEPVFAKVPVIPAIVKQAVRSGNSTEHINYFTCLQPMLTFDRSVNSFEQALNKHLENKKCKETEVKKSQHLNHEVFLNYGEQNLRVLGVDSSNFMGQVISQPLVIKLDSAWIT